MGGVNKDNALARHGSATVIQVMHIDHAAKRAKLACEFAVGRIREQMDDKRTGRRGNREGAVGRCGIQGKHMGALFRMGGFQRSWLHSDSRMLRTATKKKKSCFQMSLISESDSARDEVAHNGTMRVDLELLRILDTLLAERSVSRTAARLNLTQPAISYALAKLRDQLGDPLLVKSGNTMKPTDRAMAMAAPLRDALALIERVVADSAEFDPATAQGEILIGAEEYSAFVIMPRLLRRLVARAPGIQFHVHRIGMTREEVVEAAHRYEFAFTRLTRMPRPFNRDEVMVDTTLLVANARHPIFDAPITLERFLAYPHVVPTGQQTVVPTFIDEFLNERGLERKMRLAAPPGTHMTLVGSIPDVIATIPGRFARQWTRPTGTKVGELPFPAPPMHVSIVWHEKYVHSARHMWLRETVMSVCREIAMEPLADAVPARRGRKK
ncbi:MAG: LysR family transcriptional regulator [Betaproteobacteria bacterium]|nr:LysR family transcriptional regulator [Betaproteobacteria bacterium]